METVKVAIFRFSHIGGVPDIAASQNLSVEAAAWQSDPDLACRIESLTHIPMDISERLPIDIARSQAINYCYDNGVLVVFFINGNVIAPVDFFKSAFMKIYEAAYSEDQAVGPVIVAAPCMTNSGPNVYRFKGGPTIGSFTSVLEQIPVDEIVGYAGTQTMPCVGAQCIAYDLSAFNPLIKPHFEYACDYSTHQVIHTDDVNCHKNMHSYEQMFTVDFSCWATILLLERVGQPTIELIRTEVVDEE